MSEDELAFDLDAAGLRMDSADTVAYCELLARKLELALPAQTTVQRRSKKLFGREKVVESVAVTLGEHRYVLKVSGARVAATRAKEVRGITIKTESLELDAWVRALGSDLSARAAESAEARAALERLVG
jgi:hypothetical protein